ncbi:CIA30 family protein [Agaribacter flavus]|uniref:CIA30 family protein n=1 Tax=Agaribacter flavus TaxID=1902781 RepID=A0ABV7FWE8_9ALTE
MNTNKFESPILYYLCFALNLVLLLSIGVPSSAGASDQNPARVPVIVDDFSHETQNSWGYPRYYVDDTSAGGSTNVKHSIVDGHLRMVGDIVPPRGQPGWTSVALLLDQTGGATDLSHFTGVEVRIKVDAGNVSISANSTEVNNFDYHIAPVQVKSDGQFYTVKLPFTSMNRTWSEQTPLNTQSIGSLSIVAYGLEPSTVRLAIDTIGFY